MKYTDFVNINFDISYKSCLFLIDSQADISVIKKNALKNDLIINQNDVIKIQGITDGHIFSFGSIHSNLILDNVILPQNLHIVDESFNIPVDGILGKDFLKNYNCVIDYNYMVLTIHFNQKSINLNILEGPNDTTLIIPPNCEVVREFKCESVNGLKFINAHEVKPGVFIGNSIIDSSKPFIRVLNTTSESQVINKLVSYVQNLEDFEIYSIDKVDAHNLERNQKLIEILKEKIPTHVRNEMVNLCVEFSDVFALETDQMTTNNFYEQKLNLSNTDPVYTKNYRLPYTEKAEINRQVNNLLQNGLIEHSTSNYNSPIILVPKKGNDQSYRLCIDYRLLNKKLVQDKFPLPRIDEVLDNLGNAKYFSVLDLYSGFHQIPLHPSSRPITAFSTDTGHYQWKVVPFGLNVAPNSFSRMMQLAFAGASPLQCITYMDDLIVPGKSVIHQLKNLRFVFEICRKFNIKLNPHKCNFFRNEVTYLGHKCTDRGILPDDSKSEIVKNWPRPTQKDEVRRFVAFSNFYRTFIPNFAEIANPLNKLTRKTTDFVWTENCQQSFDLLKNSLISPKILKYPDFSKQFILTVDASKSACGAVLSQISEGQDLPISYASKTFNKSELNKSTIEKELLAIHFAIHKFRPYLFGTKFLVRSDHKPLKYLFSLKDPSSKLTRIRLDLEEYNFEVEYIPGKLNVCADALSRISMTELIKLKSEVNISVLTRSMTKNQNKPTDTQNDTLITTETKKIKIYDNINEKTKKIPLIKFCVNDQMLTIDLIIYKKNKRLAKHQIPFVNDNNIHEMFFSRLEKIVDDLGIDKLCIYANDNIFEKLRIEEFKVEGNKILEKLEIIILKPIIRITDDNEKKRLIELNHNDQLFGGHCGQKRLYAKLKANFYWKGMTKEIAKFVKNCENCQLNKSKPKTTEALQITTTPQSPFDTIIIDTIGPFTKSDNGNLYAVTIICDLSKFLVTSAIPNKEAKTVAQAIFTDFILKYGLMKNMLSDLGTEFKNAVMKEICNLLKVNQLFSTPYRHQTLGSIERNHRVFNEYLRAYINENKTNWDVNLSFFTYCYNTTPNVSLDLKFTPYELVFGKKPTIINEIAKETIDPIYNIENYALEAKFRMQNAHKEANKYLNYSKIKNKNIYDKKSNPLLISIGNKVLLEKEPRHKTEAVYLGPFIVKNITDCNVEILDPKTSITKLVHKNRLRLL